VKACFSGPLFRPTRATCKKRRDFKERTALKQTVFDFTNIIPANPKDIHRHIHRKE
jgi:hypothetical protein